MSSTFRSMPVGWMYYTALLGAATLTVTLTVTLASEIKAIKMSNTSVPIVFSRYSISVVAHVGTNSSLEHRHDAYSCVMNIADNTQMISQTCSMKGTIWDNDFQGKFSTW